MGTAEAPRTNFAPIDLFVVVFAHSFLDRLDDLCRALPDRLNYAAGIQFGRLGVAEGLLMADLQSIDPGVQHLANF